MKWAKQALDVGLYTMQREAMLAFWQQEAGVPFDEMLPVGGGVQQHRHRIGASILKINHVRDPLPAAAASGYRRLSIAREGLAAPRELRDPDGNALRLVPAGLEGIGQLEMEIAVRDLAASRHFWGHAMQLEEISEGRFRLGESLLRLLPDVSVVPDQPMRAAGWRYTTVQVFDVVGEHAGILARGGREGMAPRRLGEVAYISFVCDPDGRWIEISQRKSLTGSLA